MKLLATTIPGLEGLTAAAIRDECPTFRELRQEEGLLIFTATDAPPLPYCNNLFEVMAEYRARDIETALQAVVADKSWLLHVKANIGKNEKNFRVVVSDENRLVPAPGLLMGRWLGMFESLGLLHVKRGPQLEYWLLRRSNDRAYLLKRLSKTRMTEKDLAPGELRPELALLLCYLAAPAPGDVFLDPFTGSGALPLARGRWSYNMIFASDCDHEKIKAIKASGRLKEKKGHPVILRATDARNLEKIGPGFIDTVVTDPPWGKFDPLCADEIASLYEGALREQCRVVKPGGRIVWLTAQKELMERLTAMFESQLKLEFSADILVSGQKARVLKWRRR